MPEVIQPSNRFRYYRIDQERSYCAHVIVELGDDPLDEKLMEFFDQEYGGVRWYKFMPESYEIAEVKRLISQSSGRARADYVRVDVAQLRADSRQPTPTSRCAWANAAPEREIASSWVAT